MLLVFERQQIAFKVVHTLRVTVDHQCVNMYRSSIRMIMFILVCFYIEHFIR
jgi:hypothetical protein